MDKDSIAEIYRTESRRVLATLIRLLGDFDLAEEATQEAFGVALERWPQEGLPQNPRAWLVSTGRFKGIDVLRRRGLQDKLLPQIAVEYEGHTEPEEWDEEVIQDDQLRLIFACCHPSLPQEARIALALRDVCGLATEEIARAFLVSPETVKKRISRAKDKIRTDKIPYEVPSRTDLGKRLDAVTQVVYLIYNEGYAATSGDSLSKRHLTNEALSLCRLIVELLPEPEAIGLLALLLLHESRSAARVDAAGDLVSLEDQDRSLWSGPLIAEAFGLLSTALMSGRFGPYALQAAIAVAHASAPSVEATDWAQIATLYDMLYQANPSPVVELNKAIALAMRDGLEIGLSLVEDLIDRGELADYHPAYAARADLNRRLGRRDEALLWYRRALKLVRQEPEKRYLQKLIDKILGN